MADKITDLKESIKREILDDPKLEIIIRNHIDDLMSEIVQEIVQKYLMESSDYLINNISDPEKYKTDEIKINKTLTELKDVQQNNDFIPSAPPLPQTLPTLQKAENNIKNKGKVDRPAGLPKNLIDEIKRGVKLKPVKPVVSVIENPKINENDFERMNPLGIPMFRRASMMSSSSSSDTSSEYFSLDEWDN
ncbi:uncharacterized protein LOC126909679 [Daktulosphaira vitifoliae]|uniref:uncharacterized protein LOC126909679 n=1 Tax=Daktulosphaira vitifoliae TaxID=58002 RepID=UPI0021AAE461|nr:uncharacterized protein LOC126909679 [Daktulosphaira vitifoliae]